VALILLDLSYYELVNTEGRRLGLPWEDVQADLRTLSELTLPTMRMDEELAIETAKVAEETGLSGYDAAFVAASAFVQAPLVTTDREIIERASAYQVVHLADLAFLIPKLGSSN
jgi:predicted nucleic acid-binding protein